MTNIFGLPKKSKNHNWYTNYEYALENIKIHVKGLGNIKIVEQFYNSICYSVVATLMHTFKKNMNISIHKYIIKKWLILAHAKISNGEQSVIVANECGFNDYSGFYKQYVKMFDTTPSRHIWK